MAAASLASVTAVEAPDPSTVVLRISGPDAGIRAALASVNLAMLSGDDTEQTVATTPNGTGPFRFAERKPRRVDHADGEPVLLGRRARDVEAAKRSPRGGGPPGRADALDDRLPGRVRHLRQRGDEPAGPAGRGRLTLNLEVLESGAFVDRWVAADCQTAVALNGGRPDPDGMYGRYFTSTGNLNQVPPGSAAPSSTRCSPRAR